MSDVSGRERRGDRRLRPWMVWTGGGAIAAIAAVVVLVVALSGDKAGESPRGTAEAFVDAVNDDDLDALNQLWCYHEDRVERIDDFVSKDQGVELEMVGEPGNGAAIFRVAIDHGDFDTHEQLPLRLRDGRWCVGWDRPHP